MSIRQLVRQLHSKAGSQKRAQIFLSKDEKCFVSYHPTQDHPYECTRPLPKVEAKDESYLRVDSLNMITKAPNLEQVQNLTYTPKSYWRQDEGKAKRERYRKCFDEKDVRKGLTS
uniref:39S ribosomal protein L42, mitochondrial n=1 Tax=Aceria tosichella TaxID=561515 RepID=A0A6G1SET7_9ACAR